MAILVGGILNRFDKIFENFIIMKNSSYIYLSKNVLKNDKSHRLIFLKLFL